MLRACPEADDALVDEACEALEADDALEPHPTSARQVATQTATIASILFIIEPPSPGLLTVHHIIGASIPPFFDPSLVNNLSFLRIIRQGMGPYQKAIARQPERPYEKTWQVDRTWK